MSALGKLYLLISREKQGSNSEKSLIAAAQAASLEYQLLIVNDITLDDIAAMDIADNSLLYRISTNGRAATIESAMMAFHADKLTNIYWPKPRLGPTRRYAEMVEQIAARLPIIPTSFVDDTWIKLNDDDLSAKVTGLGGFPVLFKTLGLAHGQGVQKLSSLVELRTEVSKVVEQSGEALLREYLPEYRHIRIVVVDNQAVSAIEYLKPDDDFRTNAAETPDVSGVALQELDPALTDIALRSVDLTGSVIAGVDILVDTAKNVPYLAEVNVPCNFSRNEGATGANIGKLIIEALIRKASKR
jgi:hypothetical protein